MFKQYVNKIGFIYIVYANFYITEYTKLRSLLPEKLTKFLVPSGTAKWH